MRIETKCDNGLWRLYDVTDLNDPVVLYEGDCDVSTRIERLELELLIERNKDLLVRASRGERPRGVHMKTWQILKDEGLVKFEDEKWWLTEKGVSCLSLG